MMLVFAILASLLVWVSFSQVREREAFVLEAEGTKVAITHVEVGPDRATPDLITIKSGEYVQFNSADNLSHEIGLGGGSEAGTGHEHIEQAFASGVFGRGEAYRLQIKEKGVFNFHDHKNPNLFVMVIVY